MVDFDRGRLVRRMVSALVALSATSWRVTVAVPAIEVDILPAEGQYLAAPAARVDEHLDEAQG